MGGPSPAGDFVTARVGVGSCGCVDDAVAPALARDDDRREARLFRARLLRARVFMGVGGGEWDGKALAPSSPQDIWMLILGLHPRAAP